MLPIWMRDGTTPQPVAGTFFEVAADGFYLHKENPFWKAVVPVKRLSILEDGTRPSIELYLPPIPASIVEAVVHFFAWVWREHQTEAAALLWFTENDYHVSVPRQEVSAGHAQYEIPVGAENKVLIGTFHSHGGGRAFHSSVDIHDEESFDGLHGTFGGFSSSLDQMNFSVSIQAVINGTRFPLDPMQWLSGIKPIDLAEGKGSDNSKNRSARTISNPKFQLTGERVLLSPYQPPHQWRKQVKRASLARRTLKPWLDRALRKTGENR